MREKNFNYDAERDLGTIVVGDVTVTVQFQHGPIQDNGVNGVQNEDVLGLLIERLGVLDERFPCDENKAARTSMETALLWLEHRTALRREQHVEGKNEPHVS